MTAIDLTTCGAGRRFELVSRLLVPRPIAWISTRSAEGALNLAPFSYFGLVTTEPPTFMVSIARHGTTPKDTARNLLTTGEAVVHLVEKRLADAMLASSAEVPPETSEFELAGLTPVASTRVSPPRIAEASAAFECKVIQDLVLGDEPYDVFFLQAMLLHLSPDLLSEQALPDVGAMELLGRVGGNGYCVADEALTLKLPKPV